jgi:hypothetical protein
VGYRDCLNLFEYVWDSPTNRSDPLGLQAYPPVFPLQDWTPLPHDPGDDDWPYWGCCAGKRYDKVTHCCCTKDGAEHIVDKKPIPSGIKSCFVPETRYGYPHAYVVVDGWSAGYFPTGSIFGGPGEVDIPDPHYGEGHCKDVLLSPCRYDFKKVKKAIKDFATKPPGAYWVFFHDCVSWRNAAIWHGTQNGKGCTVK